MIQTLTATRYVTPLREGGSLPAIVDTPDGPFVLKFVGAGQGNKALIAELIAGEIARTLGLNVPEIAFIELDAAIGRAERDPEIQDLLQASVGLNLGLRYLPESLMFNPLLKPPPEATLASNIVWFDAYVTNVDRTPRNVNLLIWQDDLWLIDHGASLYFHHSWEDYLERSRSKFPLIKDHALLPFASELDFVSPVNRERLTPERIREIVSFVPDVWLDEDRFETPRRIARPMSSICSRGWRRRIALSRRPNVSAQHVYDYAVVRIVPRVEREEFINVGVILHCRAKRFLATRIDLNETRLRAFAPHADIDAIKAHLAMLVQSCEGDGPIGKLPLPERFQWLAAPRSTIIQVSEPHAGLCDDPAATLDGLMDSLVGVGAG